MHFHDLGHGFAHRARAVGWSLEKVANKTGILRKLAEVAIAQPDGIVREVLYPVVNVQVLSNLVVELGTTEQVVQQAVQTTIRHSYGYHYRRMLPRWQLDPADCGAGAAPGHPGAGGDCRQRLARLSPPWYSPWLSPPTQRLRAFCPAASTDFSARPTVADPVPAPPPTTAEVASTATTTPVNPAAAPPVAPSAAPAPPDDDDELLRQLLGY